jgi:DNA-binding response OmpR family regulator
MLISPMLFTVFLKIPVRRRLILMEHLSEAPLSRRNCREASMGSRILIVEDQLLLFMSLEDAVTSLEHDVVGAAASCAEAESIEVSVDFALVDVNLLDGATGPEIGRLLASRECPVLFLTANPEMVVDGVEGTPGVLSKPVQGDAPVGAIEFAVSRTKGISGVAPASLPHFQPASVQGRQARRRRLLISAFPPL